MTVRRTVSRIFCERWGEKTTSGAARKALEAMIPGSPRSAVPINVESAAKYVGIEQILSVDMTDCDGLLSSTSSGTYVASLRKDQGNERRRFTLAHEVGHAVIYRSIGRPSWRASEGPFPCRAETEDQKDEERLCDILATELIMPRTLFLQTMDETGICASTIAAIARRFGVSLHAASRRIAQILSYNVGIGLWTLNEPYTHLTPKWYVTKKGPVRLEYAIELGKPGSACFTDQMVRGWRWIPLHGHMDKYFVDICPIHGVSKAWLALLVFENAAQQILATISRGRPYTTIEQLPLIGGQASVDDIGSLI